MMQSYSSNDDERLRAAALILVAQDAAAESDGLPYRIGRAKRQLLAETIVVDAARNGVRPVELKREADAIAIAEATAFRCLMAAGEAGTVAGSRLSRLVRAPFVAGG